MSVWSGIDAAVEENYSRDEVLSYDGAHTASVTLRCPWSQRYDVATDVLNRLYPGGGGRLAGRVRIRSVDKGGVASVVDGEIAYDEALVTIEYDTGDAGSLEQATDPVSGQTVLYRESIEWVIEYAKLDHTNFTWTNASGRRLTEAEAPYRATRGLALKRTIYGLPALPASLLTLPDHVNAAAYTSATLGLAFPAGTLLFGKPGTERTVSVGGDNRWTLSLTMPYKEKGWNKFWRVDKAGDDKYDTIWDATNGAAYNNFPSGDFAAYLF